MGLNMAEYGKSDSKYITKDDVPMNGVVTKIQEVTTDNIGQEQELKAIMVFADPKLKDLVLNKTNINVCRALFGDDSDARIGKEIVVYHDPTVGYGGKITGGVRLRMVMPSDKDADFDDDVPL